MNIDINTFAIVMTATTAIFAGLYLRLRMMNRLKEIENQIETNQSNSWRNHDLLDERISSLDRRLAECCKTDNKSYYNSGT